MINWFINKITHMKMIPKRLCYEYLFAYLEIETSTIASQHNKSSLE